MSKDTVTLYKWFWPDQDEAQEQWLRARASEGLHLTKPAYICGWSFKKGEPADVAYRLDYRNSCPQPYRNLCEEAGWELVGEAFGWHYWRKTVANGKAEEIFTDNASKIEKYWRLMAVLALGVLPLTITMLTAGPKSFLGSVLSPTAFIFITIVAVVYPVIGYAMLRLFKRIRDLGQVPD